MSQHNCSPSHDIVYQKTGTCFTKEALIEMAKAYNKEYEDNINYHPIQLNTDKATLWNNLKARFYNICEDRESCWSNALTTSKTENVLKSLKPKKPHEWNLNPYEWLSNHDIQGVLEQYENKYIDFEFLGVFPINFSKRTYSGICISEQICNINLLKLIKKGKTKIGAVFNLSPTYKQGSHWVSLYAELEPNNSNYGIYYYDSAGVQPPKRILKLMKTMYKQLYGIHKLIYSKTSKKPELKINNIRHQFKNTECGMFSINFIIRCLEKELFTSIINDTTRDENVNKLRNIYFRN